MAVAKSYENMEIVTEPFEQDGKKYVKVRGVCPRCGGSGHYSYNSLDGTRCYGCHGAGKVIQTVRWYTDAQRATMDRAAEKRKEAAEQKREENRIKFAARNAFGFGEAGYITILWGNNDFIKDWRLDLPEHTVWYNEIFGWFIPSGREPAEMPTKVNTLKLTWEEVNDPNDEENLNIRDKEEIKKYLHKLIYGESKSEYQGSPNEWLIKEVTIKQALNFESMYGASTMHVMEDADENIYVWSTASKHIAEGTTLKMKMKVKEHKEYKGVKQTVVYYCKESK